MIPRGAPKVSCEGNIQPFTRFDKEKAQLQFSMDLLGSFKNTETGSDIAAHRRWRKFLALVDILKVKSIRIGYSRPKTVMQPAAGEENLILKLYCLLSFNTIVFKSVCQRSYLGDMVWKIKFLGLRPKKMPEGSFLLQGVGSFLLQGVGSFLNIRGGS